MDRSIINILDEIEKRLGKVNINDKKKKKYMDEVRYLSEEYSKLNNIPDPVKAVYDSLIKKGRELTKDVNTKDIKKVDYYLRYCHAALYDLKGNLKPLTLIIRSYLLTCLLFISLSPQYFSFILPIVLLIPIFLGLRGMKRRSMNGLLYAGSAMPMSFLTSITILRNIQLASKDFNGYINSLAQNANRSPESVRNLTILFTVLSVVLLISTIYTTYMGIKHRKMFV